MKEFTLPDWTKHLPDSATLFSEDLVKIFGYKNANSLSASLAWDAFPNPDGRLARPPRKSRITWSMGYLRKLESKGKL